MTRRLTFRRHDGRSARAIRDIVKKIYRDSYSEQQQADPFNASDAWMRRFDAYTANGGFDLVIAYADGESAGQAWGWPLVGQEWWSYLVTDPEPGFTNEDGKRTFALSEIMVRRAWAGRGVAHALHDELLAARTEKRATLLVEPENEVAYRAYTAWGWRKAAQLRPPWPDSPTFDVLMLPLPVG